MKKIAIAALVAVGISACGDNNPNVNLVSASITYPGGGDVIYEGDSFEVNSAAELKAGTNAAHYGMIVKRIHIGAGKNNYQTVHEWSCWPGSVPCSDSVTLTYDDGAITSQLGVSVDAAKWLVVEVCNTQEDDVAHCARKEFRLGYGS